MLKIYSVAQNQFEQRETNDHHIGIHVIRLPCSFPKRGHRSLTFRSMYCGQTAGWIKMPPGTEVGLSPEHIVFNGDPAPQKKKGAQQPPIFGPCLFWPNGWMDQDGTWYGGRPRPRRHCVRWGPSSPPPRKGHSSPPSFRSMSIVAKRSLISATAEHVFKLRFSTV